MLCGINQHLTLLASHHMMKMKDQYKPSITLLTLTLDMSLRPRSIRGGGFLSRMPASYGDTIAGLIKRKNMALPTAPILFWGNRWLTTCTNGWRKARGKTTECWKNALYVNDRHKSNSFWYIVDILRHHDNFHLKTTKRILIFSRGLQFRKGYYEGKKIYSEWQKGQMIDKYVLYKKENSVMRLETLYSVCTVQTNNQTSDLNDGKDAD